MRCDARTDRSDTDRALCVQCCDKLLSDQRKPFRGRNRFLNLSLFGTDRHTKDGLTTRCRRCRAQTTKAWQQRRSDHYHATQRRYRLAPPEQRRAYDRRRNAQPERIKQQRERYLRHREQRNAHDRERYARNRDERLAWKNDYYQRNKERIKERKRERYASRKLALVRSLQGKEQL